MREVPVEAETPGHRLLLRAGLVRQVAAGSYSHLPLGHRVVRKIMDLIRDEMNAVDGQQMSMPVIHPASLWQETGRWTEYGDNLFRFKDRGGRDLLLGPTHEEVITHLARKEINSYRQLPFMVYQIHSKFRDEPRARGGLLRLREFLMKDGYSFHQDDRDLEAYFSRINSAYRRIFRRCGLDAISVDADPGLIGGSGSREFVALDDAGEDVVVRCDSCGYSANLDVAAGLPAPTNCGPVEDDRQPIQVHTPNVKTIAELADFFNVPQSNLLKTIIYKANAELVAAAIRGDLGINDVKLARIVSAPVLELAADAELRDAGLEPGFVSPLGLNDLRVVLDQSVTDGSYVAGANRVD